jgi:tetratricopeptide (TPR) repeat protein
VKRPWTWVFSVAGGIVITLIIAGAPALYAQEDAAARIVSLSLRVETRDIERLWRELMATLRADDLTNAARKIEELDVQKLKHGFRNLPTQSAVLLRFANTLRTQQRVADAILLAEGAKRLSPDSAAVYFTLARLRLTQNLTDVYGAIRDSIQGILAYYRDIGAILVTVNTGLSVLLLTGALAGMVFVVFSFLYHRQAVFYFWFKHALRLPVPILVTSVMGWIVIGAVTLVLGVFWGLLLLAVALIFHAEKAARVWLNLLLGFWCVLGVGVIALSTTFAQFENDYFQALRKVSFGASSPHTVRVLQEQVRRNPHDAHALFGLAAIAGYAGHVDAATAVYASLPAAYPDYAVAQNNLGALYHRQYLATATPELYDRAYESYHNAIRRAGRFFEPRYNVAQLVLTNLAESDQTKNTLLQTAMNLNDARVTRLSQYLKYGIVATDARMSLAALVNKLMEPASYEAGLALAKRLWSSGSRFDHPLYFSAAALLALIISALFGPSQTAPPKVTYCQMCGEPFPVKIRKRRAIRRQRDGGDEPEKKKPAADPQTFCTQCTYIFKKKTTVKPEKRTQKVNQIQMRQNLRGLIAKIGSLLFPGGGQIYYGYPGKGLLLAVSFYLGLSVLGLTVQSRALLVLEGYAGWSLITLGLGGVLLGAAYLINLIDIFRLSPRNQ